MELTNVQGPPIDGARGRNLEWGERLARNLQETLWAEPVLIDTACCRVDNITICELDVKPDEISLPGNDHA